MTGRPRVAGGKSQRCVIIPVVEGERGKVGNLKVTQVSYVFLDQRFLFEFPFYLRPGRELQPQ